MLARVKPAKYFRHTISAPFIISIIIPLVILDICFEIYHQACFRLYGIPLIKRGQYIKIDRYKLKYLNCLEKIFCAYCGYANGLIHYVTVILGETEKYWCGIKHAKDPNFKQPNHHRDFLEYGDKDGYDKL